MATMPTTVSDRSPWRMLNLGVFCHLPHDPLHSPCVAEISVYRWAALVLFLNTRPNGVEDPQGLSNSSASHLGLVNNICQFFQPFSYYSPHPVHCSPVDLQLLLILLAV
jgi:hypothetical protein